MASPEQQQAWVPYETAKDCSQGFCSIYCPQWCYIFPPPPPFSFVEDESSGSNAFSPLVIAIIGILASAFLLVSYYTIISKYCGGFRRRPHGAHNNADDPVVDDDDPAASDGFRLHDNTWHLPPSTGLDEALISKITVYKYRRGEGLVDGTDCSVCLGEFRENESLRLLPKCSHAFHLQCIDTWLRSHSNCPLCRANIMSECLETERERNDETVVVIEDIDEENITESDGDCDFSKENNSEDIIEIKDDEAVDQQLMMRSFSVNSADRGRVSIGDVLKLSMEDELMAAKSLSSGYVGGSSSRNGGENRKGSSRSITRSLHCVMSPVLMKRSVSSGRLGILRHEKGRNSALPI